MKKLLLVSISSLAFSASAFGADLQSANKDASVSRVPESGLSLGVGGDLNLTTFGQQNFYWAGTSNDFSANGRPYSTGYAQWTTRVNLMPQVRISPMGQINYFHHFGSSDWLWGGKLTYSYLNTKGAVSNVLIPQFGEFTLSAEGRRHDFSLTERFFGTGYLQTYQTTVNNQFTLTPYLGRSFTNGFIYAGAGPSVSQVQTNLNNLIGYRNSGGAPIDQTSFPARFQSSRWSWGVAATAGVTYFITQSLYLDFAYTFSQTFGKTSFLNAWYGAPGPGGGTAWGYIPAITSLAFNTQSVNVSLNWLAFHDDTPHATVSETREAGGGWRGLYAGFNLGAAWGANGSVGNNWNADLVHGGLTNNLAANGAGGGVIGGVQFGYNHVLTPLIVVGGEADFQGSSLSSGSGSGLQPLLNVASLNSINYFAGWQGGGVNIPFFGSVRARGGVTVIPDLLIYGTGGFAYAGVQQTALMNSSVNLQPGWTAGGGVEWKFMPNWSVKAEYLYAEVSENSGLSNGLLVPVVKTTSQTPWNTIRGGLNYHFDSRIVGL
jgi:opacity protein-like surface antigen